MTTLEPGLPTTLRPGGRPRTTLSPSMARHADGRMLAFGTPGGDQQDQWQLVFLLHHLTGGLDLQAAIDAPSFHSTHFPSSFHPREAEPGTLVIEDRFGDAVLDDLRRRGHRVVDVRPVVARSDVRGRPRPGDRRADRGRQPARDGRLRGRPMTARCPARTNVPRRYRTRGETRAPWAGDPRPRRIKLNPSRPAAGRRPQSCVDPLEASCDSRRSPPRGVAAVPGGPPGAGLEVPRLPEDHGPQGPRHHVHRHVVRLLHARRR